MARDPKRIEQVLAQVEATWRKYPDLRLGQLIENAVGARDLYNTEDDQLVDLLRTYPREFS